MHDHASDYESFMAASVSALGRRGVLTRALEPKTREIMALLDQLDDLAPQFAATPGGAAFIERWQASARIIARGKSGKPSEPHGTPAGA